MVKKQAGQKKNVPQKTGNGKKTEKKQRPEKGKVSRVYVPNCLARYIGAGVCAFLAVLLGIGMFQKDAVVLDFLSNTAKGLFGYSYWMLPPVLLWIAFLLCFRREKSVQARIWCAGLFLAVLGAILHILLSQYTYTIGLSAFDNLWRDGQHLFSGGILGGFLGLSFVAWFGKVGGILLLVLIALLLLAGTFCLTPKKILAFHRRRQEKMYEYVEEIEEEKRKSSPLRHHKAENRGESNESPQRRQEEEAGWTEMTLIAPVPMKPQKKEEVEAKQVAETVEKHSDDPQKAYLFPELSLLTAPNGETDRAAHEEVEDTLGRVSGVLNSFGIDGHVIGAVQGPSVTRYEIALEQGVRLNKVTNLADDVALALGVSNVRIAPVPDKISVVGIEVPNKVVTPVPIREVLESGAFQKHRSAVAFTVGKDISGKYIIGDCSKLPHMLIAGTTGSGKSVCINSLLISLLYKSTPDEVRLIMVDPKMVELGGYNGIPHLLIPVVTDPKKAAGALQWAVVEMMKRYRLFSEAGVRELSSYNQWAREQENGETMPKVVIVIDELADLMLVAAKEVEESICRVAQMGRAAGMHLVIATQRPSADVITGLMKANIPSRIAFAVASSLESRIILDNTGAEKLVGKGDMLWFPLGSGKPLRVQGCFISDEEVISVVSAVKQNSTADYDDDVMEQIEQHMQESEKKGKGGGLYPAGDGGDMDELFPAAVDVTLDIGQASASMLQRRLKLGYARAARLLDQMEKKGVVGPSEGSKPRQILITKEQWAMMQNGTGNAPVEEELYSPDAVPQTYEE